MFAAVMSGVMALDEADTHARSDRLEAALAEVAAAVSEVLRRERRPITFAGVMALVSPPRLRRRRHHLDVLRGDEVERRTPDAAAIVAKLDELKAAQPALPAAHDLRYVHERA